MQTARIIAGAITSLLALLSGMYTFFAMQRKGPVLSNTYLWATPEERKRIDIKAEYKLVSVVFGSMAAAFALLSVHIFTQRKWARVAMWIVLAFVMYYAVAETVKTGKKRK